LTKFTILRREGISNHHPLVRCHQYQLLAFDGGISNLTESSWRLVSLRPAQNHPRSHHRQSPPPFVLSLSLILSSSKMMYTHTLAARRPRPPGSIARPRSIPEKPESRPPSLPSISSSLASSSSSQPDTPLSTYIRRRKEYARTGLARISASPSDVGDVSLGLDLEQKPSGLELSTSVEPSPPPPYGMTLPDAPTPPRQDSEMISRRESETELDEVDEEELSEEEITVSLREMRESLRQREDGTLASGYPSRVKLTVSELALAVSAFRRFSPPRAGSSSTHHSSHLHYPSQALCDYLSSPRSLSPSPERPFRTIRAKDSSLPFPHHNFATKPRPRHVSDSTSNQSPHWARMQAEADERIASLEQALAEARESEDAQRKLAARLRRNFDKLQRDFERAEERMSREPVPVVPIVATPREREGWRRREATVDNDLRASYAGARAEAKIKVGWGSSAFPEFPVGPSSLQREDEPELGEVVEQLERMTVETVRGQRPTMMTMESTSLIQQIEDMTSPASTTSSAGSTTLHRAETLSRRSVHRLALPLESRKVRKKVSSSNFAGPQRNDARSSTPLSPRLRVDTVSPLSPVVSLPRRSFKRSGIPSQLPRVTPASPSSISSRMATMRSFVSTNLGLEPSPSRGRTLDSQRGSKFGDDDDWDQLVRPIQDSQDGQPGSSDEDSDQYSEPPAPLPPHVSAALSSLALALAPHADLPGSIPRLPKRSPRERRLDIAAYELLSEAVRARQIDWANADQKTDPIADWRIPDSLETNDSPDMMSESITRLGLQPSRLHARPMATRTVSSGTDASLALAHRRRPSSLPLDLVQTLCFEEWELVTIPGKVVHDIICLLAIMADWVECVVIVMYRVLIDIRYGRRGSL